PNPQPTQSTLQSFSQYDFVPGDQVLLFEDFSQDAIGDFPTHWTTDGSGEVKQLNLAEGKWLHMNVVDKKYQYLQNFVLPDNYIVEFDLIVVPSDEVNPSAVVFAMYHGETSDPGIIDPSLSGLRLQMAHDRWYVQCYHESGWIDGSSELSPVGRNTPEHVIVWVQRRRMRVYHAGQKVMDLPTILPADFKPNRLMFDLWDTSQGTGFLTNLRVTTASPDTRSKLIEEGKLISYGIYFDLNSDKIKPESYGALHDIAVVIQQEKVKVQITGHTDNSGSDAVNLDLSKRRAASVKAELVKLGVSADALTTDGAGASNPIAANDTPSNMALNRRVEFVKQ
ncbi:MAG: OmpA family protein, partial [Alistipes sp.]|nr:OmpA family protein [Alistipes sp.]